MEKYNWMAILKTGKWIDKHGRAIEFSEKDLDGIAERYNTRTERDKPIQINHPDHPLGFGVVNKLKRVGNYLLGLPAKVDTKFKSLVNSGEFPSRSVTLNPATLDFEGVSFLSKGIKPAVTGLPAYEFSENENKNVEFFFEFSENEKTMCSENLEFAKMEVSDRQSKIMSRIFRGLRELIIEKFGADKADKVISEFDVTAVSEAPDIFELAEQTTNKIEYSQKNKSEEIMTPEEIAALKAKADKADALETENEKLKKNFEFSSTENDKLKNQQIKQKFLEFCAGDEVKDRLSPAEKNKAVEVLTAVQKSFTKDDKVQPLEFSTDEGKTKEHVNPVEFIQELIKKLPKYEFSEIASGEKVGDKNMSNEQKIGASIAAKVNK